MKKNYFFALAGSLLSLSALAQGPAQRGCASMDVLQQQLAADPAMAERMKNIERQTEAYASSSAAQRGTQAIVTIPVVVHVVYQTAAQNVSDAQIQNQINVLNQDYAKANADASKIPSVWTTTAANTNIQFCLAKTDPNGAATTGIVRKSTTVASWSSNDAVKYTAQGGSDAWPAGKYLNLWLCNLGGGLLGYAQFPGGAAATDGVVVLYSSVPGGTSTSYNMGRTATHEVGHWLNLRHIWGDASCGSDLVTDTPTQQTSNGGCPAFPHVTCSNGPNGDMWMNYMDYTYDACMYMFTNGQSTRMNAVLAAGGARASLTTSNGCATTGGTTTCAVPTGLNATSITSTGATLNWAAASGATSYNVQWRVSGTATWSSGTVAGTAGTLSGLVASTTYEFQVASVCAGGTSAYSASSTFTTTAASTGTGSTATVGTGTTIGTTTSNNTPYGSYYMDQRAQFLITKAELAAGGYTSGSFLKSLAFNTGAASTQVLNGFTIKVSHTTAASLSSTFATGTGTTQVFSGNVTVGSNIWNTHNFATAFAYDGTSNLLIDVCFNNSTYTTNTPVKYSTTASYMANYYRADVSAGTVCSNATGTVSTARPNMKLTFSTTARQAEVVQIGDVQPSVSVYPNPATSDINVAYTLTADRDEVQVEIYNQLGALVKTIALGSKVAGEHNLNIDLSAANLSSGMYVCTLRDGNSLQSVRFVLSK